MKVWISEKFTTEEKTVEFINLPKDVKVFIFDTYAFLIGNKGYRHFWFFSLRKIDTIKVADKTTNKYWKKIKFKEKELVFRDKVYRYREMPKNHYILELTMAFLVDKKRLIKSTLNQAITQILWESK